MARTKWNDRLLLRAIKREQAIKDGKLREYRMPSRTQLPAKGKGVPYKRNKQLRNNDLHRPYRSSSSLRTP